MDLDGKVDSNEGYEEPSVWDWFVSLLRREPIPIPKEGEFLPIDLDLDLDEEPPPLPEIFEEEEPSHARMEEGFELVLSKGGLRFPVALLFALFAQFGLEQKPTNVLLPILFYILAFILAAWAVFAGDFPFTKVGGYKLPVIDSKIRISYLLFGAGFSVFTFFLTRGNTFNLLNLFVWGSALFFFLLAFWQGENPLQRFRNWLRVRIEGGLGLRFGQFEVLFTAIFFVIIYFRISQLDGVPTDMWSDQAEKLLDVLDILEGKFSIFFPRNTGREGLQIYLAAGTASLFNTGISFVTLKIGTVVAGLVTLPYIYLFAKEYGGKYTGLSAMFLAGIAYWPNIISRLGLRYPLYPLFVAPALYYLVKGLRTQNRNDFLLMGFAVGLGLHGYSPARIIPLAVLLGALIYLVHSKVNQDRIRTVSWIVMAGVIALVIFLPLIGAITKMPDQYLFRMMSRIGTSERAYPGSPIMILLENIWNGLRMFAWDNGVFWVISVPHRPALDWVTGAFFHLGVVIVFVRYLRTRDWKDLFLLLSIPILMLPSILSLAFPSENPSPNRASGAIIPVFTIAATTFALLPAWIRDAWKDFRAKYAILAIFGVLVPLILVENYNLVFNEYAAQHRLKVWNTREVGEYIKGFATSVGHFDTAHVVATPHWLDGRLVAMIAGANPRIDYSIWPEQMVEFSEETRPQLFILKPEDEGALEMVQELFTNGVLSRYESDVPGRDFMIYFVPSSDVEEYPIGEIDQ